MPRRVMASVTTSEVHRARAAVGEHGPAGQGLNDPDPRRTVSDAGLERLLAGGPAWLR